MNTATQLRARAGALAAPLPPLLAQATRLASTVLLGEHGRRRAGQGDEFWQYRHAHPGDEARQIDWRRSARSDATFVRQKEWQAAQSVQLWADNGRSMAFTSSGKHPEKAARAQVLALALAALLLRGGERVGLLGDPSPPRTGERQLVPLAETLAAPPAEAQDYGIPTLTGLRRHARAVMLSDFLGDPAPLAQALHRAADQGVKGVLLQILDPAEEAFLFRGRTIFESIGGALRHETQQARDLRPRYLERLAERKAQLADMARQAGWQYTGHHTGNPAISALLWLYRALAGGR